MGIPVLSGRDVNSGDTASSRAILVVNETFVKTFLGDGNPLGKVVQSVSEPGYKGMRYEIAGVVRDTKYSALRQANVPIAYAPDTQSPDRRPQLIVAVRGALSLSALDRSVRAAAGRVNPSIRTSQVVELRRSSMDRLVRERMLAWLGGFFGLLAATLAAIGLYGCVSYITVLRRHEIAIRMALGARRGEIAALVLRQMGLPLLAGVSAGAAGAYVLGSAVRSLLFGLEPHDPMTLAATTTFLGLLALAATLLPAVRASRQDPSEALR